MKYNYDIAVIGGGSGGLVVASASATLGAKVLLVENSLMGGDCLNYGCVPSKSILHASHIVKSARNADVFGIKVDDKDFNMKVVTDYVQSVIDSIAPHDSVERFTGLGVDVVQAHGSLVDDHTILAGDTQYTAKNIVIATGSTAFVPPIDGLAECEYYTNHNIFKIGYRPKKLIVLGAGPIGLELGQAFASMGSGVTIIDRSPSIFGKDEEEVGDIMLKKLTKDGVNFVLSSKVIAVSQKEGITTVVIEKDGIEELITGDALLVSLGRRPSTQGLNLEAVGIKTKPNGSIIVNDKLQTDVKSIYVCGDATGPYQFTHMAGYQAGVVVQNALFGLGKSPDYSKITWCTYTSPEVAHVGLSSKEAIADYPDCEIIFAPLTENDRSRAEDEYDGFLKLIIDKKGRILGATIVGNNAGELIAVGALAISAKLNITDFYDVILPYPTKADIYKIASNKYRKSHVKEWQIKVAKKFIETKN